MFSSRTLQQGGGGSNPPTRSLIRQVTSALLWLCQTPDASAIITHKPHSGFIHRWFKIFSLSPKQQPVRPLFLSPLLYSAFVRRVASVTLKWPHNNNLRPSACVDIVRVGLEMTSIIYCVVSQLGSCSIINWTTETPTLRCLAGEVPQFKHLTEGVTDWAIVWGFRCKSNELVLVICTRRVSWLSVWYVTKLLGCRVSFCVIGCDELPHALFLLPGWFKCIKTLVTSLYRSLILSTWVS